MHIVVFLRLVSCWSVVHAQLQGGILPGPTLPPGDPALANPLQQQQQPLLQPQQQPGLLPSWPPAFPLGTGLPGNVLPGTLPAAGNTAGIIGGTQQPGPFALAPPGPLSLQQPGLSPLQSSVFQITLPGGESIMQPSGSALRIPAGARLTFISRVSVRVMSGALRCTEPNAGNLAVFALRRNGRFNFGPGQQCQSPDSCIISSEQS